MRLDLYAPGSAYQQQRRWTHPHSLRCLETAVELLGQPASLLDVGCAEGVHVDSANARGIAAMGIDLACRDDDANFVRADLCHAIYLGRQFEWVICWEVAEHLPAEVAGTLIDTLVRHMLPGGRILFTAARPGQKGIGHIHCNTPAFWQGLFAERGLSHAPDVSARLRKHWVQCSPKTPWYGQNVAVFWRVA